MTTLLFFFLVGCSAKKQEKAFMDAKCKKINNLMNENGKRRMEFLDRAGQVVIH